MSHDIAMYSAFSAGSGNQSADARASDRSLLSMVLFWAFLTAISASIWFAPPVTCKHTLINAGGQQV